ncbi:MAG: hypothetical protein IPJ66_10470 [Bacteroidetes bacterium]|nr:hypothetical protein [Bacteroidota bacterium]
MYILLLHYTVTLIATHRSLAVDTLSIQNMISVQSSPIAQFSASTPCFGDSSTLQIKVSQTVHLSVFTRGTLAMKSAIFSNGCGTLLQYCGKLFCYAHYFGYRWMF